jgi:16S rRNA (guanine527-N7)-methyltransferase
LKIRLSQCGVFHVKQKSDKTLSPSLLDHLSPNSVKRLHHYVHLIDRWRKITNLISEQSFSEIWPRHIEDSIQLQQFRPAARRWLDLGTGAGFPGIVIGTLIADRENAEIYCVESDGRKCAFLRSVVDDLQIPVKVYNVRAETISQWQTGAVDIVTARAFSSIEKILAIARDYLLDGAEVVLPRGSTAAREVEKLDSHRYMVNVEPNPGHGSGVFLAIREKARRS